MIITWDEMSDLCYDILEEFSKELGMDYCEFLTINDLTYELRYDMSAQYEYHVIVHDHYADMKFSEFVGFFGDIEFIKWLYRTGKMIDIDIVFLGACRGGKMDVVEWSHKHVEMQNYKFSLYTACMNGHLEIAQWLHENGCKEYRYGDLVENCCEQLEILKWIYNVKPKGIVLIGYDVIFEKACIYNNLDVAKWIYSEYGSEYLSYLRWIRIIKRVCGGKNLEMVKLLSEISSKNKRLVMGRHTVICAIEGGDSDIIIWLLEHYMKKQPCGNGKENDYTCAIEVFDYACASGDLGIVKMVYDKGIKDIENAMWCARENGHYEIVHWCEPYHLRRKN